MDFRSRPSCSGQCRWSSRSHCTEAAHGYVAKLFGDRTAEMLGRITLNPLKHIDLVGTILVPGILLTLAWINKSPPFVFGVGEAGAGEFRQPAPTEARHDLGGARRDPASNFLQALALGDCCLLATAPARLRRAPALFEMADIGFQGESGADGAQPACRCRRSTAGACSAGLLPRACVANAVARSSAVGLFILLALLALGLLDDLMRPLVHVAAASDRRGSSASGVPHDSTNEYRHDVR